MKMIIPILILYVIGFIFWSMFEYKKGYYFGHREGYRQALEEKYNVNLKW